MHKFPVRNFRIDVKKILNGYYIINDINAFINALLFHTALTVKKELDETIFYIFIIFLNPFHFSRTFVRFLSFWSLAK